MTITTATLKQLKTTFNEQGYVILRQAITPECVASVRAELAVMVDEIAIGLRAMDRISNLHEDAPFQTRLMLLFEGMENFRPQLFRSNLHRAEFYDLFFCPGVLDLAEFLLGPEVRLYPNYSVRPKMPNDARTQALWHQDAGYTESAQQGDRPDGLTSAKLRMVNIWSSLVPATPENGCMQFIPGSHRLGVVPHEDREHFLQITEAALSPLLDQAVDITTEPGDIVLFSNLLFHQGQPNCSQEIRWSCDWRYQDATQPTLRAEAGHLARSKQSPRDVVSSRDDWAKLRLS